MKKNYLKLLPLILVFPGLMANAPAPQVFNKDYKDYQLSFVKHEQNGDDHLYTYHLKNAGKGYIDYVKLEYETRDSFYCLSYYFNGGLFNDIVAEPGFNQDIVMSSYQDIPNVKQLKAECKGYQTLDEKVNITGTKAISYNSSYNDVYYYKIDLNFEYSDTNWNYGAVLKLEYDEDIYYVKINEQRNFQIEASQKLDLSKLSVLDVSVIKSRPYMYGILDGFAIVAIVFFVCFFLLVGGGIFAAIFIPKMVRRKRRNRAKAAHK